MLIIFSISAVCAIAIAALLLLFYPSKLEPFSDKNGHILPNSISEKAFVNINDVKQGMIIKSKNSTNPVLLYLHGGMPDYFLTKHYPTGIEDYFTMVWWKQRGSGLSFNPRIPADSLNVEQMISDTLEVTNYLRRRFGKEKIYLMCHSCGSFIGIQAARRSPDLYHAYIGVAQMSNQLKSETLAYEYMLEQFKKQSNKRMMRKLEAAPFNMSEGTPDAYLGLRDKAMHSLGVGTIHDMKSVVTGLFFQSLRCQDYSFREKINLWRAKASAGVSSLWDEMLATDLSKQLTNFEIPIYFFEGIYDYTCSYVVAKDYFEKLHAPLKGFYTFDKSAHSPIFEEPQKVQKIMLTDVLKATNSLAD